MNAIEQSLAWMELDKRCCGPDGFCLKCDTDLKDRFERTPEPTRRFLVDTLCSCSLDDFQTHRALLWLVAFLDGSELDRFVGRIARFAPFETSVARTIIRLSEGNGINIFFDSFNNHASPVRRRFHLHPALAPALLAATIRSGSEAEDAIALLNYFHPIAHNYPALQSALPIWQAERKHREEDDRARWLKEHEQSQIEADRLSEELAASEHCFQKIESGGTESILRSILDANTLTTSDCPERWTHLTEKELANIPHGLLEKVALKLSNHKLDQHWEGLKKTRSFRTGPQYEARRALRRGEFMNVQRWEAAKMPGVCREQRQTQDGGTCGYEAIGNTHAIGKVKLLHPDICSIPDFR